MTQTSIHEPVDAARMAEAETLLSRYPNVDPGEAARILRFMRQAPAIEVALLTCKDHLKAPIERFRDDHRDHFELNWRRIARIWGPVGLVLTALALGWLLLG